MQHVKNLWRLIRPHQWTKNTFVLIGLIFGHAWDDYALVFKALMAAIAFCLISSTVYVANDIFDADNDRLHPKKKNRPIAARVISVGEGWLLAAFLCFLGLLLGLLVSYKVMLILMVYLALNCAYSLSWKHIVILDVFCIASGFMLRIFAGTIGLNIPPSKWLLLCSLMLTLFLGFAKRRAELTNLSQDKKDFRLVLEHYDPVMLDGFLAICAACVIITYSLYTMSVETVVIHNTEGLIYTVPFVAYGMFRYLYLLHYEQKGGEPSRDLIQDPHIMASVFSWTAMTVAIIIRASL